MSKDYDPTMQLIENSKGQGTGTALCETLLKAYQQAKWPHQQMLIAQAALQRIKQEIGEPNDNNKFYSLKVGLFTRFNRGWKERAEQADTKVKKAKMLEELEKSVKKI